MRKSKSNNPYSGYIAFPILGAADSEDFRKSVIFKGKMVYRDVRNKLFSKNRKFIVEIFLKKKFGFDVQELELSSASMKQLCRVLHTYASSSIKNSDEIISYHESYFKVRFKYEKE